jgi:hypothetical protein
VTGIVLRIRLRRYCGISSKNNSAIAPQSSSASRLTAGCCRVLALEPVPRAAGDIGRAEPLRNDAFEAKLAGMGERRSRRHSTKADNGIPIVTTFSSVSGALMEQLIFEFASLSSCPTNCTDFLRNLIRIRTAILHYLNKYRTIATTDTKASAQELWRAREFLRARGLLRQGSGHECNQKASGESIECHELHGQLQVNRLLKGYFTMAH